MIRIPQKTPMAPARLAMLLERVLAHVEPWRTREREYIRGCIDAIRSGKRAMVSSGLFRRALLEINECSVIGCNKTALYRFDTSGFCRVHRGVAAVAVQVRGRELAQANDARRAAFIAGGREAKRNLNGAKFERFSPPRVAGKPAHIRTEPGLDVLGLQAMISRRRRNLRRSR